MSVVALKEERWIKVKPNEINRRYFFKEKREDEKEEKLRRMLCEAFYEVYSKPQSPKDFEVLIPRKRSAVMTGASMKELAAEYNGHVADWTELCLIWAQIIQESGNWNLCHRIDEEDYHRFVIWKNGKGRIVGGSRQDKVMHPATHIGFFYFDDKEQFCYTVPLIVR